MGVLSRCFLCRYSQSEGAEEEEEEGTGERGLGSTGSSWQPEMLVRSFGFHGPCLLNCRLSSDLV